MAWATLLTGVLTPVLGVGLAFLGIAAAEAGRGGYGIGPFPMLKVSTDWTLVGIGVALLVIGSILAGAGLTTLGVTA